MTILLVGCGADQGEEAPSPAAATPTPTVSVSADDFVGSDACRQCHEAEYDRWAASTHGRAGGEAGNGLVIAPFDGEPIRFRDAVVLPEIATDGTYRFVVRQDGFPESIMSVDGVVGGGHMLGGGTQGFVSNEADGTSRFLPFDYSRQDDSWFCNTGSRTDRGWVRITPDMPLAECGDWPPVRVLGTTARFANCQSCHGSQIRVSLQPGAGRTTQWTSLSVNCESCHGPGRRHVEWAGAGTPSNDIGLASRVTDGVDESLGVCFACHALKDVVTEGYFSGMPLEDYYALKLPVLGDDPYHPDGRVKTFAYQGTHLSSSCYVDGSMTCVSCHEPHGQTYWDINRSPLADPFDDGQCTSCHAAKAAAPEEHTYHAPGSDGAKCVSCHMPYLQHAEVGDEIPFARSDHTIPIPRPGVDGRLGVVSACRGCHTDRSELALDQTVQELWGTLKPHRPLVAGMLAVTPAMGQRQAAGLLLHPDERDPLNQFQALARFLTGWVRAGQGLDEAAMAPLDALTQSDDLDVRALALATRHWAEPGDGRNALVDTGDLPARLTRRWVMILSFLGDQALAAGDQASAETAYLRALDVQPDDPGLHLALGLAYNQVGDFPRAMQSFNRSLEADPNQPLAYVNLGIAQAAAGDPGGAIRSYQAATRVDPGEPLAHFNLGNVHLRGGNAAGAVTAYQTALRLAPDLGQGHFNLALALIQLQRFRDALPHARRAVEFSPGDDRARQMLMQLEQQVGDGP